MKWFWLKTDLKNEFEITLIHHSYIYMNNKNKLTNLWILKWMVGESKNDKFL